MAVSHTFSFAHTGGSTPLADTVTVTGEIAHEGSISIPGGTTDQQEAIAFSHTNLRSIYIKSDVTLTLETNATDHTGGQIFTITAGVPFVWNYQSGVTNPFTAAVTTCYFTNATDDDASVFVRVLVA
jgi:hypothetical protein